jgi:hypothetical protein
VTNRTIRGNSGRFVTTWNDSEGFGATRSHSKRCGGACRPFRYTILFEPLSQTRNAFLLEDGPKVRPVSTVLVVDSVQLPADDADAVGIGQDLVPGRAFRHPSYVNIDMKGLPKT